MITSFLFKGKCCAIIGYLFLFSLFQAAYAEDIGQALTVINNNIRRAYELQNKHAIIQFKGLFEETKYKISANNEPTTIIEFISTIDLNSQKVSYQANRCLRVWRGGAAPYIESSYTIVYDGAKWVYKLDKKGPIGSLYNTRSIEISSTPPIYMDPSGIDTLQALFLSTKKLSDNSSFTTLFNVNGKTYTGFKKIASRVEGKCDVMEISDSCTKEVFYQVPEEGLFFQRIVTAMNLCENKQPFTDSITVNNVMNVSGIFLPKDVVRTISGGDKLALKQHIKIESIKFLDDKDGNLFAVDMPKGYAVTDKRFNMHFIIGDDPDVILQNIKNKNN
ncbi:MAG: hypothetical protein LBH01_06500 [Verrucomicrobiales bacterium]|jgi:hypothetical protein|nr:hypothetical protein [Verrucomicrobiales bacterium]